LSKLKKSYFQCLSMQLKSLFGDLLWLVYPPLCAACDRPLHDGETCICTSCRFHLPRTGYHRERGNAVEKLFWGNVPLCAATAFFHFSKGEGVQALVHRLKYKGRRDIGRFLGDWMGQELLQDAAFASAGLIVPVPLHPRRLRERGYNQSVLIAEGLSQSMGLPYADALVRTVATPTQTRKHRFERFRNVGDVFAVGDPAAVAGRHILLVDDVLTTGSTLIGCATALLSVPGTRISVAALAVA
jgi:ComF family protein